MIEFSLQPILIQLIVSFKESNVSKLQHMRSAIFIEFLVEVETKPRFNNTSVEAAHDVEVMYCLNYMMCVTTLVDLTSFELIES